MRKTISGFIALLALVGLTTAARAEVKTDAATKIQYEIPAGFTETVQGKMSVIEQPKKEIAFFIVHTDAKSQEKAMADLDATLSSIFKDVKAAKDPTRGTTNGLKNVQIKATATYNGKPVNMTLRFYETPTGTYLIVVGAYETAKKDALKDTFNAFYNSIKPAA